MGGEARFARPVNALVHLAPAVDRADVADRRAVDTRVEIAAENLREIGGVLRALVHHHPDLLAARLVALVVEVHVQHAQLAARTFVAQPHPVAVARPRGVPRTAAANERRLRQPVAPCRDELITVAAEEDHVLADEMIPFGIRIHLRPCESVGHVAAQLLFQIGVGVVDRLLQADDVGTPRKDRLDAQIAAVLPDPFGIGSVGFEPRDTDVARHHAVDAVVGFSLFAGFGGTGE